VQIRNRGQPKRLQRLTESRWSACLVDPQLSAQLQQRFGLTQALAVWADGDNPEELYGQLGRAAARHLTETVSARDVLGFDTGRTVSHIADHLDSLASCDVVQLSGLAGTVQLNGLEILRRVTEVNGGNAYPLYAPMIAPDTAAAAAYRQQPEVQAAQERYRHLTTAIVSVGSWDPPMSQVYDRFNETERHTLLQAGAVAETCALMFDQNGKAIHGMDDRRIGIPLADLKAVTNVIAGAGRPRQDHRHPRPPESQNPEHPDHRCANRGTATQTGRIGRLTLRIPDTIAGQNVQ